MIVKHNITEADAIYFNHLSYQIGGIKVLLNVIKNKVQINELAQKYIDLVDERRMLSELLVEKYGDSKNKSMFVNVNLKTMTMEVAYAKNDCNK